MPLFIPIKKLGKAQKKLSNFYYSRFDPRMRFY
jgi:hypothetical protein